MTLDDEIASLARQLQGALDVAQQGGVAWLPRPSFVQPRTAVATSSPPVPAHTPSPPQTSAPPPAATPAPTPTHAQTPAPAMTTTSLPIVSDDIASILASSASSGDKLARLQAEVIG